MSPAKTSAERQAAFRQAKQAAGLSEVRGIFAHPDDHDAIRRHAERLTKRRAKATAPAPNAEVAGLGRNRSNDEQ